MKENIVDVFDAWLDSRMREIHTCIPGQIESYSTSTRKAKVKVLIKSRMVDGTELDIPPIENVPVTFPSSGDFSLTFPLKSGDGCLILFSEEGIGNFLNGNNIVVSSDDFSRFNLTDAICIPGLWSFKSIPQESTQAKIKIESSSKITVETKDGGKIVVDGENIIMNNGTKGVARKDDAILVNSTTDATIMTFLQTHTHSGVTTGAGISGPPVPPTPTSITGKINESSDSVKAGN